MHNSHVAGHLSLLFFGPFFARACGGRYFVLVPCLFRAAIPIAQRQRHGYLTQRQRGAQRHMWLTSPGSLGAAARSSATRIA